jgi:hypothetical protein
MYPSSSIKDYAQNQMMQEKGRHLNNDDILFTGDGTSRTRSSIERDGALCWNLLMLLGNF